MKILPINTCLGRLAITEIYEYLDGPKLFCARNKLKQAFICYWCESSNDRSKDGWLYLPVSENKLEDIRRGKTSLRDAFYKAEEGIFLVYVDYTNNNDTTDFILSKNINKTHLPPDNYFVETECIEFIDTKEIDWNHDVRIIKKGNRTNPSGEAVSSIISKWTTIFESLMNHLKRNQTLYPVYAMPGSFEVKFSTSNNEVASECFIKLIEILESDDLTNLDKRLFEIGLEVSDLKQLFDAMDYHDIELEISPKALSNQIKDCYLNSKDIEKWSKSLEGLTGTVLNTNKIPQADLISNIIKLLELKASSIPITEQSFGLVDRQIRYYTDAAVLLGYTTQNGSLTSQGRFLLEHESEESRMAIIADNFQSTDCAMAWKKWSDCKSMRDLKSESAAQFIKNCVPGLSENTAERRAKTLTNWLKVLSPYYK